MTRIAPRRSVVDAHDRHATFGHALARAAGSLILLAALAAAFGGWVALLL